MGNENHDALARAQVESIGIPENEPSFLPDPVQDRLIEAAIAIGGELWVEREHRLRLESVLIEKGVLTRDEVEACALSDEQKTQQRESLDAMVKRLFGPLTTLPGNES